MKTLKMSIFLLALLLAAMIMVPIVSAVSQTDGNTGGMELTKTGYVSAKLASQNGASPNAVQATYTWTAGSNIWSSGVTVSSTHYSYSRLNNAPYDINTIEVRGRVWKNNNLMWDQTQTAYNAADASLNYNSGIGNPIVGSWFERSNHRFIDPADSDSWTPVTEKSVNC